MNISKVMKASSMAIINPNFPLTAAVFHSTPILSLKKRTYWPERSDRRGPPRKYKNFHKGFTNPLVKQLVERSENSSCDDYVVLKCDRHKFDEYMNEIRSWCGQDFLRKESQAPGSSCNSNDNSSSRNHRSTDNQSGNSSSSKSSKVSLHDTTLDRLALGLSATGPLNLEVVKTAYRACAVKWHPDHHLGFSKAFAEEKFKKCNAAYESLCNHLSSTSRSF